MKRNPMVGVAASCLAVLLGACAHVEVPPTVSAADSVGALQSRASIQLSRLLADSDEALLRRNPVQALFRGDMRYAAQLGDHLSDAHVAAERSAASDELRRLASIDRAQLTPIERIAYASFAWQRNMDLRLNEPAMLAMRMPLALEHLNGRHLFFPGLSSGNGAAPYRTEVDYDNGLARINDFVAYLDRALARSREGLSRGVVQPRLVVEHLIDQFDTFIAQGVEGSTYYGPIRKLPTDMAPLARERLTRAYAEAIRSRLIPAFARVRDGLKNEVLPNARASVGLSQIPGGAAYYRLLVEVHTTTRMTPEQIHALGLSEVTRITTAMRSLQQRIGFPGSLAQFQEHLRTDARFKPTSAAALGDAYRAIGRRVDAAVPRLFATLPKTPLEIRPTPAYQEKTDAAARYMGGSADGTPRPGVFFFNTFDLPSRATFTLETTYLHEAVPGHHFQISLAQENEALPKLLRFGGNTAYGEGWALYAESLGPELGMETDPYQLMGAHNWEMWRAVRLVVDTGIHAMGWSRERSIDYMLAHSANSRTDTVAEVERYIANPGQALAYKVGELTIRRLRGQAEATLGPKFDLREFHGQVLDTGALPLDVLATKIEGWIAAQQRK